MYWNRRISMSIEENVQIVKDFFAAIGRGDKQRLLELSAEDIEWIIPGDNWPLAGTRHGHAGLADLLQTQSETVETSLTQPSEFVAQGDRVMVIGFAKGRIIATDRTFEDDWVFAITVQNGKVSKIREYIDTQALARASGTEMSAKR
jgi:ketosteroid isomerase-like protein